ncbi:hypothetical protein HN51_066588, partial [Arachis hypogaea]
FSVVKVKNSLKFYCAQMTNGITHEPSPSMLVGRFNALLPQRQGYLKAFSTKEIIRTYGLLLSELTSNVNPIITDLTIIAGQQRKHAKGIADAICNRILE